jgi:hypothetical protein
MAEDDPTKGGEPGDNVQMVPSARLREETSAKRKALARVAELESMLEDAEKRAGTADTLAQQIAELKAAHKSERDQWESTSAVYGVGIYDPEAIDVARHLHSRLPEKDRPPLHEWLKDLKGDPTKAPRALAAYLAPPEPADPEPPPKGGGAPAAPRPPARAAGAAPSAGPAAAGSSFSAEQIAALREEAVRTGDWTRWREAQPAILASLKNR